MLGRPLILVRHGAPSRLCSATARAQRLSRFTIRLGLPTMARADVPDGLMALYKNHTLRNDCSGFVRAAAAQQNNMLPTLPSDALIGHIEAHWTKIGQGTDAQRAIAAVRDGYWVIALLKASE